MQDNRVLQIPDDNYRTYYELFVYSFYDSDGDGIGDLQGVLEKLDYLNDGDDTTDMDLGINGIWLMPVMPPSPIINTIPRIMRISIRSTALWKHFRSC